MVVCLTSGALAQAQSGQAGADPAEYVEEVVSIGVRASGRTAVSIPVPVDSISSELLRSTGQTEVGRMLQAQAPSFNFSSSTVSDGTDALRPATLRGLGPDQTLVLINGKRRHGSALVHVNTSVGRGTAGTDMNAIPAIAIKRVEILRDGSAAQYGSDAIAGVINLVLEDADQGGELNVYYGEYSEGDGATGTLNFQYGNQMFNGEGSWRIAVEYRDRENTNRAGLSAVCQYRNACTDRAGGGQTTMDPREIAFNRTNFRIGDADSEHLSAVFNLTQPFASGRAEFYLFATYSDRDNESGGFYRRASQEDRNPTFEADGSTEINQGNAYIADGFLPLIQTGIRDSSINLGFRGEAASWEWDLSIGTGGNEFRFDVANSLNASLVSSGEDSPRTAFAGELVLGITTAEINVYRPFDWGGLALGASFRQDRYEIQAGEELSWRDYDTDENGVSGALNAIGGIQVFPGFRPENAVDEDRDSSALYLDIEWNITDSVLLSGAARYEDYSDFGRTVNFKGAALATLTDTVTLRGAISTSFRAPSLQQQYFNNVSTQFRPGIVVGMQVGEEVGTFRNDSAIANALGIPELQEENAVNYGFGVVWQPAERLTVTLDYYRIEIEDRIVLSGQIKADNTNEEVQAALDAAGIANAQFFLNAADTETTGVDIIISYDVPVPVGNLDLSFGANFTETEVVSVKAPEQLSSVDDVQNLVFTSQDRSILEEWQPERRMSLSAHYVNGRWDLVGAAHLYGEYTVQEGSGDKTKRQTFGEKYLVDLSVAYNFTDQLRLRVGGNNVFDEVPDKNTIGQSRAGIIVDGAGNVIVDSEGVFTYSRRSAPFGFNGAYWYASLSLAF